MEDVIIPRIPAGFEKCPRCNGSGKVPRAFKEKDCGLCDGAKKVLAKDAKQYIQVAGGSVQ